jgi:hypothetical protein
MQYTSSFHQFVLSHTLMASQVTSGSHHLFSAFHNVTVDSVSIVLYVARGTLCLSYNGFKGCKDE